MTDSNEFNEYTDSSAFPPPAREQIPADYLPLIDGGNAGFFGFLEEGFPQTYSRLLELPAVRLFEMVSHRQNWQTGETYTQHVYLWTVPLSAGKQLFIEIPNYGLDSDLRIKFQKKYVPYLPPSLGAFYRTTGGMRIAQDFGLTGEDFPLPRPWAPVSSYYPAHGLDEADPLTLMDELQTDELHVIMALRNGDFVVCDLENPRRELFVVRHHQTDRLHLIEQPAECLDAYFSACLRDPEDDSVALATERTADP